jgi:outer membrane lipoprotein carrier protein
MISIITIYLVSLLSIFQIETAALPEQESMNDPKAKEVLDKVSATFKGSPGIHATFSQTTEAPGGKPNTKQGEVFVRGDMYKVAFDDQQIYCDRQSVWTYLKDINEVQINDYEPDPSDISPSSIFNIYQSDFFYMKEADETISGVLCHVIELTPKDKSRPYFKVRMWVDKKTNTAKRVKIFDKNGYRYVYNIKTIDTKMNLDEGHFRFNKADFPGVKVEDLRM